MAKVDTATAMGASGTQYEFDVYPWGTTFGPLGAVYLVLRKNGPPKDGYEALYVGQTGNLGERFDDHHKKECFDQNHRTHIGIRLEASEHRRLAAEQDLLHHYKTVCNF